MKTFKSGFVLVTTLWVLAMLTMAAGFISLWTQRSLAIAQARQEDIQGEIDSHSTQANVIYLLTSQRMTIAGLTVPDITKPELTEEQVINAFEEETVLPVGAEITLDDRPYFGHGKAYFALQDEAGLFNPMLATEPALDRLLGLLGVEAELRGPLIAKLQDYMDLDDWHRLHGAESAHYNKRNLPPPTNHFLRTPLEVKSVLDWAAQPQLWQNNLFGQLTTLFSVSPNFNTAPLLVLQAAYNMTAESAERLINLRQTTPFLTLSSVTQIANVNLEVDPFEVKFFPSSFLRLTLWYAGARRIRQVHIELTPAAHNDKPWQIKSSLELGLSSTYTEQPPRYVQATFFTSALSTESP